MNGKLNAQHITRVASIGSQSKGRLIHSHNARIVATHTKCRQSHRYSCATTVAANFYQDRGAINITPCQSLEHKGDEQFSLILTKPSRDGLATLYNMSC